MPDDFTVAISQRRVLEMVAGYGAEVGPVAQQEIQLALARGIERSARVALALGDEGACEIYAALAELICSVAREQLQAVV